MGVEMSAGQKKRTEKVERLRKFFGGNDRIEIHEWVVADEGLEFSKMSDREVEEYLKNAK